MKTSTSESSSASVQILARRERIARFLERALDMRLGRLGVGLYRPEMLALSQQFWPPKAVSVVSTPTCGPRAR